MNRTTDKIATEVSQALADRMAELIQTRDISRFSVVYHDEAEIWHNFDDEVQSKAQNLQLLEAVFSSFKAVRYTSGRITFTDDGFVKQHNLECVTPEDDLISMPTCQVIRVEDDQVRNMAEYLDPTRLFAYLLNRKQDDI